ncbi:hypothetical protein [Rhizobium laguerreae]|uniref:hypothetical protein n=1 Tax=Rhizobium laguerreae TaxID=1076926 RepID=UPI001C90934A|nr:hypothetical protein [Rhizobium laguerreae]MBY3320696.1 hypothetical protein [Rhizobium laguerreae]
MRLVLLTTVDGKAETETFFNPLHIERIYDRGGKGTYIRIHGNSESRDIFVMGTANEVADKVDEAFAKDISIVGSLRERMKK